MNYWPSFPNGSLTDPTIIHLTVFHKHYTFKVTELGIIAIITMIMVKSGTYIIAMFTFQMNHVIDACCTFLEQQLEAGNAIGIASFAQQHGCMDLYRKANTFIEQHFSEVC